jgi:transcriptional regulator with XRE-family HTH domain
VVVANSLSQAFGVVLRERRLAARISQEELAQAADLHPTYVSMIERGVRNPTLDVAARLAKALRVSLLRLIDEAENFSKKNRGRRSL